MTLAAVVHMVTPRTMKWTGLGVSVFCCCISLICWSTCDGGAAKDGGHGHNNPGMTFIASRYGVQYASYTAQKAIDRFLLTTALPNMTVRLSGTELLLSGVKVRKLYLSTSRYELVAPATVRWSLTQKKMKLTGHWRLLRVPCNASGAFNTTLVNVSQAFSVSLGRAGNRLKVQNVHCSTKFDGHRTRSSNRHSTTIDVDTQVGNKVKSYVEQKLCEDTRQFLKARITDCLSGFPTSLAVEPNSTIVLDAGLMCGGAPIVRQNNLYFDINGCLKAGRTSYKLQPAPMTPPSTVNSMYYFLISQEVFNALFAVGFNKDATAARSSPQSGCLPGPFFHVKSLSSLPDVELTGRLVEPPTVEFQNGRGMWTAHGSVKLTARNGALKSLGALNKIDVSFRSVGSFEAKAVQNRIRPNVDSIDTKCTVRRLSRWLPSEAEALPALKAAISESLEQTVNAFLHRCTVPLPLRPQDALEGPAISFTPRTMQVSTDLLFGL